MKKSFFKTAVCLVLSLAMLLCFASCGSSSDKYVDRLDDLKRDGEINGYYDVDEDSMDYYEESYNESYDIDVEIEAMYRVSEGSLLYGSSVTIIEFKTASQAKSYQKAYEEQMNIGFSAKVGRVLSFFTGEFYGELSDIFTFAVACERDGSVVIFGTPELVELVMG